MKKRKILGILSAIVITTIGLPVQASAASWLPFFNMTRAGDKLWLKQEECAEGCIHEYSSADFSGSDSLTVESGKHTIVFDGVKRDFTTGNSGSPLKIMGTSEVTLELKGENILKGSKGNAGVYVGENAKLIICASKDDPAASLTAEAREASGIGGNSKQNTGAVEIKSGTITATGNGAGAGIGSKSLYIEGGNLTVSGGRGGIASDKLESKEGVPLTITGSVNTPAGGTQKFHGISKTVSNSKTTYKAYGNAVWGSGKNTLLENEIIVIDGGSLRITDNFINQGEITGSGKLINANKMTEEGVIADTIQRMAVLTLNDIEQPGENALYKFDGTDLTDVMFSIRDKNGDYTIDKNNWEFVAKPVGFETERKGIVDAGKYEVICENKVDEISYRLNPVTVYPQQIDADDIVKVNNLISISKQTYTGQEIKPEPKMSMSGKVYQLQEGIDYTLEYPNDITNVNTPEARPTIKIIGTRNFTGQRLIEFDILQADIRDEEKNIEVKIKDSDIYDNKKKELECTVPLGKNTLNEENYTVTVLPQDKFEAGDAGIYRVAIDGKENCKGNVIKEVEIKQKPITISTLKAEGRQYDGTAKVKVTDIALNEAEIEAGDVLEVDTAEDLYVDLPKADAAVYDNTAKLSFSKAVPLKGDDKDNYIVKTDNVKLSEDVEITIADAPAAPLVTAEYTAHPDKKDKFQCKVSVSWPGGVNPVPGEVTYEYAKDLDEEEENPDYDAECEGSYEITPAELGEEPPVHTFYARVKGNNNVKTGAAGKVTVTFKPVEREQKPSDFTLKYTENDDKETFTAEIPEFENPDVEYSFDGENWDAKKNKKTDCESGMSYTGYVRFKATPVYLESEWTTSTSEAPKVKTKAPAISPDGGKIMGRQVVSISCETEGAQIYYTLDNTNPTQASKPYTGEFDVTSTATVKAMAVKPGMEPSDVVSASFTEGNVQAKPKVVKGIKEISEDLKATEFNTPDAVKAKLKAILTAIEGYTEDKIAYYDISLEVSLDGVNWEPATVDNFPAKGVEVTVDYPEGTGKDTHDFAVCHMFGENSDRLGITAGDTELPAVTKTPQGLKFTMKGMSPVAIAWKDSKNSPDKNQGTQKPGENPNGNDGKDKNNGKDDPNNPNNSNDKNDPNNPNDKNDPNNPDNKTNGTDNKDGTNSGGAAGGGNGTPGSTNGTVQGTKAGGQNADGTNAEGSAAKGLNAILPKTGDPANILLWLVLMDIALVGIVATLVIDNKSR